MNTNEVMLAALQQINKYHARTCPASGVGTITDTTTGATDNDYWNGGVVFYYNSGALVMARVLDFAYPGGLITHDGGSAASTSSPYWLFNGRWSKDDMILAINAAQKAIGPVVSTVDEPIVLDERVYGLGLFEIARVCVLLEESPDVLSNPYRHWRQEGGDLIVHPKDLNPYYGKNLRVWGNNFLPVVSLSSNTLPVDVDDELVKWETVLQAALIRGSKVGMDEPQIPQVVQLAQTFRMQRPRPFRMPVDARYSRW